MIGLSHLKISGGLGVATLALVVFSGCSSSAPASNQSAGSGSVSPAGPASVSASQISPAENATDVDVGTAISLQLSEPLAEVSSCVNCQINGLQFVLTATQDATQTPIPGSIQISGSNIDFVPSSPLDLNVEYTVNFSLANADVVLTSTSWNFTTEQLAPDFTQDLTATNQTLAPLTLAFYQKLTPADTSVILWEVVNLPSGAGSYIEPDAGYSAVLAIGQQSTSVELSNGNDVTWNVAQNSSAGVLNVTQVTGADFGQWSFQNNSAENLSVTISMNGNPVLPSSSVPSNQSLEMTAPSTTSFFAALVPLGTLPGTLMEESQVVSEVPIFVGQSAIITGSAQTGYSISAQ